MISPDFTYLLKVNLALILFYAFYRLFCTRDTFFHWRRFTLLAFWVVAWLYPFMNVQDWIQKRVPVQETVTYVQTIYSGTSVFNSGLPVSETTFSPSPFEILSLIYFAGIIFLGIRLLIQLVIICRMSRSCRKSEINGVRVHLLKKNSGPFSFFCWIFIHPGSLQSMPQTEEILSHERTHVSGWHSIDVLISELNCIMCWINPFSWLLRREIRNNLEYLADRQVVLTGHDTRAYQYHLLRLAHPKAAATLYNHFNVLPIKKRIMMMNKKRTSKIGGTKYFMFLPLLAILMICSNIEAVARSTMKVYSTITEAFSTVPVSPRSIETFAPVVTESKSNTNSSTPAPLPQKKEDKKNIRSLIGPKFPEGSPLLILNGKTYPGKITFDVKTANDAKFAEFLGLDVEEIVDVSFYRKEEAIRKYGEQAKDGAVAFQTRSYMEAQGTYDDAYIICVNDHLSDTKVSTVVVGTTQKFRPDEPDKIYKSVNQRATFKGKKEGLLDYLNENLKTAKAVESNRSGNKIILTLTVEKDGSVGDIKITESGKRISSEIKNEVINLISNMPAWEPAMLEGNVVRSYSYYGVDFEPAE